MRATIAKKKSPKKRGEFISMIPNNHEIYVAISYLPDGFST